ncbi:putative carboxylesterase 2 [Sesamum angolense]|uniref:Carboxylesterase 2 n=1 Tax=Sesamum angolense TaxID=2727404 RepID=A0AAE1WXR8_9LAMI|nr:putative carboxylesterase 2 [Sesamum angolense]
MHLMQLMFLPTARPRYYNHNQKQPKQHRLGSCLSIHHTFLCAINLGLHEFAQDTEQNCKPSSSQTPHHVHQHCFCLPRFTYSSLSSHIGFSKRLIRHTIRHFSFIRVYTNGTIQRFIGTSVAPPFTDPVTRVRSKDIVIDPTVNVTARLYLPGNAIPGKRIPLLVYFHGGAFFTESAASPPYHRHLNSVVGRANVVAVSVNYRLAPENPLPVCYEDSWLALKWVFSHLKGYGKEPWIKNYVDFRHVHVGGDSAGANIAHNMAIRAGSDHEMGGVY